MTDDTNTDDTTEENSPEDHLPAGSLANDTDSEATLVVIADPDRVAENHVVHSAGESVAEMNPEYPENDPIRFCCYREALDSHFGDSWRRYSPEFLAFKVGDQGVPVYSFPVSRLTPAPSEWPAEDQEESP
jgi:hypothetical protein